MTESTQIEKELRAQEAQLARQRAAYEELSKLGRERARLLAALDANTNDVLRAFRRSRSDLSLSVRGAASALGVGRATLNRWLRLRPDVT